MKVMKLPKLAGNGSLALVSLLLAAPGDAARGEGMLQPPRVEVPRGWDGGFSFRVTFAGDHVEFGRTSNELPGLQQVAPAYRGEVQKIFSVGFGDETAHRRDESRGGWEHRVAEYELDGRVASVVLSRLSPAVLVDSPGREITLGGSQSVGVAPTGAAFVLDGKVVTRRLADGDELSPSLDEPWILAWFGSRTPYRGYRIPVDVSDPLRGSDKSSLLERLPTVPLDLPLLIRLEHAPGRIRVRTDQVALRFDGPAGKIAFLPLFGGRLFRPEETEKWTAGGLPREIVPRARRWSRALRDFPLTVEESYRVDTGRGELTVSQGFRWLSFDDDWKTPSARAAPVPPMLALALGGDVPVHFFRGSESVRPVDYQLMDTPGKALAIEGCDRYEFRLGGLGSILFPRAEPPRPSVPEVAKSTQRKLERHVREMIDAGPLKPLFYVYGGIGGSAPAYFYWADAAELAQAVGAAFPFLSPSLRQRAREYLETEFERNPPLRIDRDLYRSGASRAPYEIPWGDVTDPLPAAERRESERRTARMFGDLYGVHAFHELTGVVPGATELRRRARSMLDQLLARQDWALCAPIWRSEGRGFFRGANYFNRNGQARCNAWLAGAIGFTRLARDLGWTEDEPLGWYAVGKLALARIGQARYTAEMHRMGLVEGPATDDWRTLVHVDRNAAIVARGALAAIVREDQEIPPFIDLVREVGTLLGRHARDECRIYLGHLDRSMPLWYLSEAPKQSATEQRLCPLQHHQGNVLAQYWIAGKRGPEFRRYVDVSRFRGDLYYIQNLAALLWSYTEADGSGR